jgi:hypothetical protein
MSGRLVERMDKPNDWVPNALGFLSVSGLDLSTCTDPPEEIQEQTEEREHPSDRGAE